MKKNLFLILCFFMMDLSSAFAQQYGRADRFILSPGEQRVVYGINQLSFSLMREIHNKSNVIISPFSIACLLSLTNDGASGGTRKEISSRLEASPEATDSFYQHVIPLLSTSDDEYQFKIANALFVNKQFKLKKSFRKRTSQHYSAFVRSLDFSLAASAMEINEWCARQTEGMIPSMVDETSTDAFMYALNAVYFENKWSEKFRRENTEEGTFTNEDGKESLLPMMRMRKLLDYAENEQCQMLRLHYAGGTGSTMCILLPKKGHTTTDILQEMNNDTWRKLMSSVETYRVSVKMPRFETENEIPLNNVMKKLGLTSMFDPYMANFRNMASLPLYVSIMKQKAKIEVNEEGTKAAAITQEIIRVGSTGIVREYKERDFHADHPFIYIIRDNFTNAILFIGEYHGA